MDNPVVTIDMAAAQAHGAGWIAALEAGKVLYLPRFGFEPTAPELALFRPEIRDPKSRNISLNPAGRLAGVAGDAAAQATLQAMVTRFRDAAEGLLGQLVPRYGEHLRRSATSFRPSLVETRPQSWRADDRRLHVDAFPSRPSHGQRLLRVFTNVNPAGVPRVWRLGEPFPDAARRFMPRFKRYSAWQARALHALHVTKSLRGEYDHLMLQLHDAMKADEDYQKHGPQVTVEFPPGSAWICFSDQTAHAAMAGQYLLEHTMLLAPTRQYDVDASPLAILRRLTGRALA